MQTLQLRPDFILSVGGIAAAPDERAMERQAWRGKFDAVINVSDTPELAVNPLPGLLTHWFPIQETSAWGYSSLFASKRVLDWLWKGPARVLVHCHGGTNRSLTVAQIWLDSVGIAQEFRGARSQIKHNLSMGHMPAHYEEFLQAMNKFPNYSELGIVDEIGQYREVFAKKPCNKAQDLS